MASFLDNITQFTPYQQEIPLEATVNTGLFKENQYQQGVQRIQQGLDETAALPIAKDVSRQYLHGKLGDLKNKLSTSLSSDFSDQRIVNQIGGLTRQIASDPVIQKGVSNTLQMQAKDKQLQKDISDGKYNPANEGVYMMDRNSWLNDGDVNSDFGANYSTPVDYNKKALDVLKIVTQNPTLREADIPFRRDASGNYLRDKSGNPMLDEVMVREKYSGVPPEKIQQALSATFDESDINQLNIEGRWHYRGASPEDMYNIYAGRSTSKIASYNANIDTLKTKKLEKGAHQDEIQQAIEQYQDLIRQEQNTISQISPQEIAQNPDAFKSKLYTSDYLNTFSNAFSFENKTSQLMENLYQSYRFKVDQMNREWSQLGETRRHNVAEEGIAGRNSDISAARLDWEMHKPGSVKGQWGQGVVFQGTTPVNDNDSFKTLNQDIATTEQTLKGIKDNVLTGSSDLPGVSLQDREKNLEDVYNNYNKNGVLPQSPDLINYIKQRKVMERDNLVRQQLAADANKFAQTTANQTDVGKQMDQLISSTGYNINSHLGNLHFTPGEVKNILYTIAKYRQQNIATGGAGFGTSYVDPREGLSQKEQVFYDRFVGKKFAKSDPVNKLSEYFQANSNNILQNKNRSSSDINSYINTHTNQYLSKSGGIPLTDEASRQTFGSDLTAMLVSSGRNDSDSQTISKWATDKNTTFSITAAGSNSFTITAANKGDVKQIKISADEAKSFFGSDFTNPYDNVDQTIKHFGSTNFAGIQANPENSYFQTFDMNPSILSDRYSGRVKADIFPIPNTGEYKIRLWYNNPNAKAANKWQSKDIFQKDGNGYNLESAYQYITSGIGDNTIESIFK